MTAGEEENVIQLGQNTRSSVNVGYKRPKLSDVTISEWNVANNKILFHLIGTGRLPTYSDIKSYLVYSVKINQLASKYGWLSVLQYDEDYRINQNKHSFPWTYDNMHMHTYLLNPHSVAPGSGRQYRPQMQSNKQGSNAQASLTVDVTQDGMTICKKFNRFRGCNFDKCSFAHVCNCKSLLVLLVVCFILDFDIILKFHGHD